MNSLHIPRSVSLPLESEASRPAPKPATRPLPPRRTMSASRAKDPTTADARISSLRILALALLKRIECLENDIANGDSSELNLQAEVNRFEAELIRSALIKTGGRQRRAAKLLGAKVTTLNTKIRRYAISVEDPSPVQMENIS
jgi:transcriptional regulator with GAF, ATPase, and Fis domain